MWFDETGLPWIDPSPNIRSLDAALTYSGLVLFEATNLTVGRGTDAPFSYVGAPWLDTAAAAAARRRVRLPASRSTRRASSRRRGLGAVPRRAVRAVRIRITDRDAYQPVWLTLVLMTEIRRQHPNEFRITNDGMTQMLGSRWAREAVDRGHCHRRRGRDGRQPARAGRGQR
jgi:uncharacterized protein YbbC (DUF1343 family)